MKKTIKMLAAFALITTIAFSTSLVSFATSSDYLSRRDGASLDLTLSPAETLHRGFQIIDGNIHDRYGDLFFELDESGRNPFGEKLCVNFFLSYASDMQEVLVGPLPRNADLIHDGAVWNVQLSNDWNAVYIQNPFNMIGRRGVQFQHNASFRINIGVTNRTLNRDAGWQVGVNPNQPITIDILFGTGWTDHWQGDTYMARVSGNNGSGTIPRLTIRRV